MTNTIKLTATQRAVLTAATKTQGRLDTFPGNVKGGARAKVVRALLRADLIQAEGSGHSLTAAGYAAIGQRPPKGAAPTPAEAPAQANNTSPAAQVRNGSGRRNSKQARVITMLQRPEGATIAQICEATGWQAHTVRGTFSGVIRRRLGLTIVSEKPDGGERVYRIA